MTYDRIELLKMLANAEEALSVAASQAAALPDGSIAEEFALKQLAELQGAVRRIEKLLNDGGLK